MAMLRLRLLSLVLSLSLVFGVQSAQAWRLEAGQVTIADTAATPEFTAVTFQESFDTVPVVVSLPTIEGTAPRTLRIRNVTLTGFEITAVEASGTNGPDIATTVDYVAIEPGIHKFPNGTQIAAGKHSTTTIQSKFLTSSYDTVPFGTTLSSVASVVATIQTTNSETGAIPAAPSNPFLTVSSLNSSTSSIQLALERSEDRVGTVLSETIGWIAFPSSNSGTFLDVMDNVIGWAAQRTTNNIIGWGTCTAHTFSNTSWVNARVVGIKRTRDGGDGGWLRRCSLSDTSIGLLIDEDTVSDSDRAHTTEAASLLAFSNSFHAEFSGKIASNKTFEVTEGTYALPGNIVRHTITAQSTGSLPIDLDSLIIVEKQPANTAFRVVDIDAPGSGPILFTQGGIPSTLTITFEGLASLTDDIDFSNDEGLTFTYIPSADGAGADANITHIRVHPKGTFQQKSATGNPSFSIAYDAVIK